MGRESDATLRIDGDAHVGAALLETAEIIVRSEARFTFPFAAITSAKPKGSKLEIAFTDAFRTIARKKTAIGAGKAVIELEPGEDATKWADAVRAPKSVIDKLGIKPGHRVAVVGAFDASFLEQLPVRQLEKGAQVVMLGVEAPKDLEKLKALRKDIDPEGGVWVVRAKGPKAPVAESKMREAAEKYGWVVTKVVAFSATHTADKLVVPVRDR